MTNYFSERVQEPIADPQRNLENLVRSIQMSLGKRAVLIAVCDYPGDRTGFVEVIENTLEPLEVVCCRATIDRHRPNVNETLLALYAQQPKPLSPTVVNLVGTDELLGIRWDGLKSAQEQFFFSAQWSTEGLATFGGPVVVWVSSQVAIALAREAPDFWNGRGGVFQFERPLMQGETASDRRDLAAAIEGCERAVRERAVRERAISERAISERELNHASSETLEFAQSLAELAQLYEASEQDELAVALYERVLKLDSGILGENHPETIAARTQLAELYERTSREEQAAELYQRALELCRESVGSHHPETAASLNQLAYAHRLLGDYAMALPLYKEALAIRRDVLGENHESTATSLNNLAGLQVAMGDYDEALPLYEEAVKLFDRLLGSSHPRTIVVRTNLGALRERMGH